MATLVSPGVAVSVTDESFYAGAGAGTVPVIVIATGQDKTLADASTAAYTTFATAGKLYLITS
jgi:Trk K+ transport system NAD-binding subunit